MTLWIMVSYVQHYIISVIFLSLRSQETDRTYTQKVGGGMGGGGVATSDPENQDKNIFDLILITYFVCAFGGFSTSTPFVSRYIHLALLISIYQSTYLSIYQYTYLPIYQYTYTHIYLFINIPSWCQIHLCYKYSSDSFITNVMNATELTVSWVMILITCRWTTEPYLLTLDEPGIKSNFNECFVSTPNWCG